VSSSRKSDPQSTRSDFGMCPMVLTCKAQTSSGVGSEESNSPSGAGAGELSKGSNGSCSIGSALASARRGFSGASCDLDRFAY
jgi:hypothetical protein